VVRGIFVDLIRGEIDAIVSERSLYTGNTQRFHLTVYQE
jgi:hypothetical protein